MPEPSDAPGSEPSPASPNPSTPPRDPHHSANPVAEAERVVEQAVEEIGEVSTRLASGAFIGVFEYLGEIVTLFAQSVRAFPHVAASDVIKQMSVIGVDTVPIAMMTVGFSGAVLSLYSVNTLSTFGATSLIGGIVALSIFRETAPILVGVVESARAGSAMTAEIGSMKVTEQIDALRSMAISPIEYLVAPRVLAALIMSPVVTLFADAAGTLGGAIVAITKGVSYSAYQASVHQFIDNKDIVGGLFKSIVFGILVALIGCREGMQSEGGAAGVGQSTTRSVVTSIVLIFIANFLLSFLLYNSSAFS